MEPSFLNILRDVRADRLISGVSIALQARVTSIARHTKVRSPQSCFNNYYRCRSHFHRAAYRPQQAYYTKIRA
ncbi:hypothetical protein IQ252_25720 [Tychonema sp. LEGE 07203]|nr:hypothetical protein [Tychonema sp. LEGE 07203]